MHRIGLDDDFIDLGSHSLQGLAIASRLEAIFGIAIPAPIFFEEPTVAELSTWINRHLIASSCNSSPVRLQEGSGLRAIFAIPGGRGDSPQLYGLAKLARAIDPRRPLYGFPCDQSTLSPTTHLASVELTAQRFNTGARAIQSRGPYLLLGVCVGGVYAWEMTWQLEAAGEPVHLILVDARNLRWAEGERPFRQAVAATLSREDRRARRRRRREWRVAHGIESRNAGESTTVKSDRVRIARAYEPAALVGDVTLLANRYWRRVSPDLGWGKLLGDRLNVIEIESGHGPEWHEPSIARAIKSWLEVVDPVGNSRLDSQPDETMVSERG